MDRFKPLQFVRAGIHLQDAADSAKISYWRDDDFHQREMLDALGKACAELGFAMVPAEQTAEAAE